MTERPAAALPSSAPDPDVERLLTEALVPASPLSTAAAAEAEALMAFRAARDSGALDAPPRPSDDWRPRRAAASPRFPLRTYVGAALAGLSLSGVAVASTPLPAEADQSAGKPAPATRTPSPGSAPLPGTRPSSAPVPRPAPPSLPAASGHTTVRELPHEPGHADGYKSLCRKQLRHRAKDETDPSHNSAAWQRLAAEAGGDSLIDAYCARALAKGRLSEGTKPPAPPRGEKKDPGGPASRSANGPSAGGKGGSNRPEQGHASGSEPYAKDGSREYRLTPNG
ncbi:hypothetical protein H4W23_05175 [Streptomyces gardneri]|uniref:hypothetical protein n=1 Tax=Streptomyces gardneri TaxID=66892 RepID=UPI0006E2DE06|nr:hypothetical protein [Streptomyces gardneri]QPK44062.1 hypothetical protein H4W23_05175 [Streptomyces gardneri]WRK35334.1 hypothetical protein U0M97_05195 [Streptomyces venezuelae]